VIPQQRLLNEIFSRGTIGSQPERHAQQASRVRHDGLLELLLS
jgi:hypothetical protein